MAYIRLRAVGDDLIHKQLYAAARKQDGTYDFHGMFTHIRPLIDDADISVINQETMLVTDRNKISSFPFFGSPHELAGAIADAGFDVVTHASNHALDKGYQGIKECVSVWEGYSDRIIYAGIHETKEDSRKIRVIHRNGIKVAVLNYTQPLNYHLLPPLHPYCVDVMKNFSKNRISAQIREARQLADAVVVFPHWGCEYLYEPVEGQKKWAAFFADAGADLIIGTHPHVLQNMEDIHTKDGRTVPCIYSLGNYISCQVNQGTMLGGMADVEIKKTDDGKVSVEAVNIIPLVTHTDADYSVFITYPLSEYSDELCHENKIFKVMARNTGNSIDMAFLNKLFSDIMDKKAMDYSIYRTPADVRRKNIQGVMNTVMRKNTKE